MSDPKSLQQPAERGLEDLTISNPEKQQEVNKYTLRKRKHKEKFRPLPMHKRIGAALEHANRRFWYKIFKVAFYTDPIEKKIPIKDLKSLLIIPIGDAVGDMVVTLPIVDAIKRRNPHVRIGVIKSARNESLLRCEHGIDKAYTFVDRRDWRHFNELLRARRDGYQVVMNLHFPQMTEYGLVSNIVGPKSIKISVTHAYRKNLYRALFNHLAQAKRFQVHLSQLSLRILDDVIQFEPPLRAREARLRLTVCEDTLTSISSRIDEQLKRVGAKWFIYYNPEARNPFRELGLDKFVDFARRFTNYFTDAAIFVTSSPVRQTVVKEAILTGGLERVIFFDTTYDLLELAAICRFSKLVVTPDTSVIHFAAAENKPSVILWADNRVLPIEWLPMHAPSVHLCPAVYGDPVNTIPVDSVVQSVVDILEGKITESRSSYDPCQPAKDIYQESTSDDLLITLLEPHLRLDE